MYDMAAHTQCHKSPERLYIGITPHTLHRGSDPSEVHLSCLEPYPSSPSDDLGTVSVIDPQFFIDAPSRRSQILGFIKLFQIDCVLDGAQKECKRTTSLFRWRREEDPFGSCRPFS